MTDWLSFEQILGYVASAILLSGYAIKSDVKTKTVLIFSSVIFVIHFFLLGAFTASAVCAVNTMRNASSIFFHKSKAVFIVFAMLYIASGYFTYDTFIGVLPSIGALLTCAGMFLLGGIPFRVLVVVSTVLWLIHNIMVGSIGGTINFIILLLIGLVTIWRLYKDDKKVSYDD